MAKLSVQDLQAIATAIPKYFSTFGFIIGGKTYTTAEVLAQVNAVLTAASDVATAANALKEARLAQQNALTQNGPFIIELRQFIAVAYSNTPTTLAEFAIAPKKARAPLSNAARTAAEAKAKATRAARGTKGKKQKAAITGNVVGVSITPIVTSTTPSAPAPAPAVTVTPAAPAAVVAAANGAAPHA